MVGAMKLLVVGPDIRDLRKVKNFTGVQAYYLADQLRKRGVELHFIDPKPSNPLEYFADVDGAGCDHVLALGLRYFTHQPVGIATILKTKVPGAVTQLHDGLVHSSAAGMENVDCTFTFRDDQQRTRDWHRYADKYHYIGTTMFTPVIVYTYKGGPYADAHQLIAEAKAHPTGENRHSRAFRLAFTKINATAPGEGRY